MGNNNKNGQQVLGTQGQPQPTVAQPAVQPQPTVMGVNVQPVQTQPQSAVETQRPTGPKVRKHKVFGEYKKCIIHPTKHAQSGSVFISVNNFTYDAQPETEIELPIGIIQFLKEASAAEHFYDKTGTSENGNRGAHSTRYVKKYIVEVL